MNRKYVVLIADIKSSRLMDVNSRYIVQEKLQQIIKILNSIFRKKLILAIDFSSGDSIQGLFNEAASCIECFYLLRSFFAPYEIRCGIGIGDINNKIFDDSKKQYVRGNTNYNDGSAYHLAKSALDLAKEKKLGVLVFSECEDNDIVVNNFLFNAFALRSKLTIAQFDLMNLYEYLNPLLSDELFMNYEMRFSEIFNFIDIKEKLLERNMLSESLLEELEHILLINRDSIIHGSKKRKEKGFFSSEITSRSTDYYFAKLFGVSPQNIALLRKRGHMNHIRTLEELGKEFLRREYD